MTIPTFKTWKDYFNHLPSNDEGNTYIDGLESVLKHGLNKKDYIDVLRDEPDTILMSVAPITKELQFLHHVFRLGGSCIKASKEKFVVLQGFGPSTPTVIIDSDYVTQNLKDKASKIENTIHYENIDDIISTKTKGYIVFQIKSVVLLPHFLAETAMNMTSYEPADVLASFISDMYMQYSIEVEVIATDK